MNLRMLLSFAAGLLTTVLLYQPIVTQKNAQIAHLEVEQLRMEAAANQAAGILHHERLMHFGMVSKDLK